MQRYSTIFSTSEIQPGVQIRKYPDSIQRLDSSSDEELDQIIASVYRQVLGNMYVMQSERLLSLESRFKRDEISVREFVRQVAKSGLYYNRFVAPCSRSRTIELNFKHLLGRAPYSYQELATHGQIYDQGGLAAEIDSYLDSEEYLNTFGEDVVPYARGHATNTGQTMSAFTHWFNLERGLASSDTASTGKTAAQLTKAIMRNQAQSIDKLGSLGPSMSALNLKNGLLFSDGLTWEPARPPEESERKRRIPLY